MIAPGNRLNAAATVFGLLAFAAPCAADGLLTGSLGFDYSSGDYGESTETEILYLPASVKYEVDRWTLKATLSWLTLTGPEDTVLVDGQPISRNGDAARTTRSGPGDITASVAYSVYENAWAGIVVDVIGKIKFPTADESKGLGGGETDYASQVDGVKSLGDWSLLGSLGHRWLGAPPGTVLHSVWYASAGVARKLNADASGGLLYDYREAATERGAIQSEVTLYAAHRLDAQLRLQAYLVRGFADGSPDWSVGAALSRRF
jgi:hypothetical protein